MTAQAVAARPLSRTLSLDLPRWVVPGIPIASALVGFAWTLHAYCLLPNHYHLIVEATRPDLSTGMQRLNGRYAQRFNQRYDRVGHVFQNRFSSYVIESEEHLGRALAYVHANPIEAGLCERPEEWPWTNLGPLMAEGDEVTRGALERFPAPRKLPGDEW